MNLRDLMPTASRFTETDRVLGLPLIPGGLGPEAQAFGETFRRPGGTWTLKVAQSEALYSISKFGGLVGALGVGAGKTLIAWLSGRAAGAETVVILMRPSDVKTYEAEVRKYQDHFDPGPSTIHILPYSRLSDPRFGLILEDLAPDLIVADEAQSLIGNSARARRFWRYMEAHPETTLVAMSGTLFDKSVADAAGLAEHALGVRSPLPHEGTHLETWQHVLDPRGMASEDERDWFDAKIVVPMGVDLNEHPRMEAARMAAGRRFVQSQGVVFTPAASTDVPLTINRIEVPAPTGLVELINKTKADKVTPDGEELIVTDMQAAVVSRMIASGFYTRWAWERVPGGRDEEWLARRSAWNRGLARELDRNSGPGYDSEKLVGDRVLAECIVDPGVLNASTLHFNRWRWGEVSHRPVPPTVPVWVDTFMIDYVMEAYRDQPVIIWYSHQAVEQELIRRGVPVFGSGTFLDGPARMVGASIAVHGTGRNLQAWNHAVVLEPPTGGMAWEQLLGRLHRQGQEHPVTFDVIVTHEVVRVALRTSIENAKFIQGMQMTPQRLLTATWT